MGRQHFSEISGSTFLRDNGAHAHLLRDQGEKCSSCVRDRFLPYARNPLFSGVRLHFRGLVETKALRISEYLNDLVGDDLRLLERSPYDYAGSPTGVNADSDPAAHVRTLPQSSRGFDAIRGPKGRRAAVKFSLTPGQGLRLLCVGSRRNLSTVGSIRLAEKAHDK